MQRFIPLFLAVLLLCCACSQTAVISPSPDPSSSLAPTQEQELTPTPSSAPQIQPANANPLELNLPYAIDMNADNIIDTALIFEEQVNDKTISMLSITLGSETKTFPVTADKFKSAFIYNYNGTTAFLVSSGDSENGSDYATYVWVLNSAPFALTKTATLAGYIHSMELNMFTVKNTVRALGTYEGWLEYLLINGTFTTKLTEESPYWIIYKENGQTLTTAKEIAVFLANEEGNPEITTIPAGTVLVPVSTNCEDMFIFMLEEDDTYGHLSNFAPTAEGGFTVDTMDEYECFESLPY